jgi:hypothetical protein
MAESACIHYLAMAPLLSCLALILLFHLGLSVVNPGGIFVLKTAPSIFGVPDVLVPLVLERRDVSGLLISARRLSFTVPGAQGPYDRSCSVERSQALPLSEPLLTRAADGTLRIRCLSQQPQQTLPSEAGVDAVGYLRWLMVVSSDGVPMRVEASNSVRTNSVQLSDMEAEWRQSPCYAAAAKSQSEWASEGGAVVGLLCVAEAQLKTDSGAMMYPFLQLIIHFD